MNSSSSERHFVGVRFRKCHGTGREYSLGSTKPPGLTDTKYTKAIFQGNFKLFLPEYSAISKNKYQQTRASFPWKQCKIAVCVILVLKMWRLREPFCTFEFSGSNTAFYSRSLTTTQETKKFMASIEVPWRLQIDKPDQWRGHDRRPYKRKNVRECWRMQDDQRGIPHRYRDYL